MRRSRHPPLEQRFWPQVEKTDTCWLWRGWIDKDGYGNIHGFGKQQGSHRVAWMMLNGAVPDGLVIDHICRVRNCVNPEHLRAITFVQNVMCGEGPCARHKRKTHCTNGHELTEENVHLRGGGKWRSCRICERAADKRKRGRRREKQRQ